MTKKTFQMETISCPSCIMKIEGALKRLDGIEESEVLFNSSRVKVDFDETKLTSDEIKNSIEKIGYKVISEK
ncbi:heavy-metal-associated domain-containing protein [Erysipelothrix inopinata]|uniref:Heavy-metal-associated domain-containing protein n=1 Tax=Erysipelothrix inopinata TaxID=225084 RepID=A0A7G9RWA0_9FIRM|nr:heavy-metal-associated domain-containing protein [Erysipelothrix inopinata]QNN59875.1 heavy-metal-associated domain-containing protein [Erysipelothrix inopinata]